MNQPAKLPIEHYLFYISKLTFYIDFLISSYGNHILLFLRKPSGVLDNPATVQFLNQPQNGWTHKLNK